MFRNALQTVRALARSITTYGRNEWAVDDDDEGWIHSDTSSGVLVGRGTAYKSSYWFRGINLISSAVAKTPIDVIDTTDGRRVTDKTHPSYQLLGGLNKPNPMTLRFHFVQSVTAQALGHGGGFAYIFRDERGRPTELLQLRADRTFLVREDGRYLYVTSIGGNYGDTSAQQFKMLPENVLHIYGLGWDGMTGYSVLELAAESIGGSLAKERFGTTFFRNSASPSVIVKVPRKMSDKALANLRKSWSELRTGLSNAHKPVILEDGMDAQPFSVAARDAQLIEAMERDPITIANFLGLPGYKLGVQGATSYASLEIESQSVLDDAIDPWLVPWEQALDDRLLTEDEKKNETRCHQFRRRALVRVDIAKRFAAHRTALGGHPFRSINEVRLDENEDPVDGYDFIPQPLNMQSGKDGDDALRSRTESKPDNWRESSELVLRHTVERMVNRVAKASGRKQMSAESLLERHETTIVDALTPAIGLIRADADVPTIAAEICRAIANGTQPDEVSAALIRTVLEGRTNDETD